MEYLILYLIGCALFVGFTTFILIYIGIKYLPSFSDSYYELEKRKDRLKFIFQGVMIAMAFLFAIVIFEVTEGYWFQFVGMFSIFPIAFVGFAPRFQVGNLLEREVHFTAAITSAVSSLVWVLLAAAYNDWTIALTIPISASLAFLLYKATGKHTKLWWGEMACFWWTISTIGILLIERIKNTNF